MSALGSCLPYSAVPLKRVDYRFKNVGGEKLTGNLTKILARFQLKF